MLKTSLSRGAWVAQSVKCLTSAQVMISWFMSPSPALGSVLTTQWSPLRILSPCLSAPPPLILYLCLSKINVKKKLKHHFLITSVLIMLKVAFLWNNTSSIFLLHFNSFFNFSANFSLAKYSLCVGGESLNSFCQNEC